MRVSLVVIHEALDKVRDGLTLFFTARKVVDIVTSGAKKCPCTTVNGEQSRGSRGRGRDL